MVDDSGGEETSRGGLVDGVARTSVNARVREARTIGCVNGWDGRRVASTWRCTSDAVSKEPSHFFPPGDWLIAAVGRMHPLGLG